MPTYKLVMVFKSSNDKSATLTISDADPAVTQAAAIAAMDAIIAADIFQPSGMSLVSKTDCKLIATTESDFYDRPEI